MAKVLVIAFCPMQTWTHIMGDSAWQELQSKKNVVEKQWQMFWLNSFSFTADMDGYYGRLLVTLYRRQ
jgi:hypothetical protein